MRNVQVKKLRKLFAKKFAEHARDSKEYKYGFRKFKKVFKSVPRPNRELYLKS
jgi:hypothetical protein